MKKSFTLIEILVVIFIIGLLSAVLMVNISQARKKSRDAQRAVDLTDVAAGLEKYYLDEGHFYVDAGGLGDQQRFDDLVSQLYPRYLDRTIINPFPSGYSTNYAYKYVRDDVNKYHLWFKSETSSTATCKGACGSLGSDLYLIKNGKVSTDY